MLLQCRRKIKKKKNVIVQPKVHRATCGSVERCQWLTSTDCSLRVPAYAGQGHVLIYIRCSDDDDDDDDYDDAYLVHSAQEYTLYHTSVYYYYYHYHYHYHYYYGRKDWVSTGRRST